MAKFANLYKVHVFAQLWIFTLATIYEILTSNLFYNMINTFNNQF